MYLQEQQLFRITQVHEHNLFVRLRHSIRRVKIQIPLQLRTCTQKAMFPKAPVWPRRAADSNNL